MKGIFHMSLPCKDLQKTITYYKEELGLKVGRSKTNWVDINLFGSQLTFVEVDNFTFDYPFYALEQESLPSFHFGVVLENDEWEEVYDKINRWSTETIIKKTFFKDKNGEQSSFFVKDPNDYYIEFKTFTKHDEIFM